MTLSSDELNKHGGARVADGGTERSFEPKDEGGPALLLLLGRRRLRLDRH
jgi:hypothetical protein